MRAVGTCCARARLLLLRCPTKCPSGRLANGQRCGRSDYTSGDDAGSKRWPAKREREREGQHHSAGAATRRVRAASQDAKSWRAATPSHFQLLGWRLVHVGRVPWWTPSVVAISVCAANRLVANRKCVFVGHSSCSLRTDVKIPRFPGCLRPIVLRALLPVR